MDALQDDAIVVRMQAILWRANALSVLLGEMGGIGSTRYVFLLQGRWHWDIRRHEMDDSPDEVEQAYRIIGLESSHSMSLDPTDLYEASPLRT